MSRIDRDIDNFLAIVHDLASKATGWISRPAWVEFSNTNFCNLECVMCSHADGLPTLTMARKDTERILEQVLPDACLLTPSAGSEPMLGNMRLILEHCRRYDVHLNMVTNATVLDGDKLRAMADRIQRLYVSLDCHVPEVFEKIRPPARFRDVEKNVEEIVPVAAEEGIPLGFVVVFMADNAAYLADYVDYIAGIGGRQAGVEIRVQPMIPMSSLSAEQDVGKRYSLEKQREMIELAFERARTRGIILRSELPDPLGGTVAPAASRVRGVSGDNLIRITRTIKERYPNFCNMASYYMKIDPDGTVFPCCRAPQELVMGNALESSIESIWNGERYQAFRRRMHEGDYPQVCRTCDVLIANPAFRRLEGEGKSEDPVGVDTAHPDP